MQLTVREAARLLNVSEGEIYRWVSEEGLPAIQVDEQFRFNKTDLLEWVTAHKGTKKVTLSPEIFRDPQKAAKLELTAAMEAGGVHADVGGSDRDSVLRALVTLMRLPEDVDREFLLQMLAAREAAGSTGVGNGIAIPHVRNPLVLNVTKPTITVCFLKSPVDFGAADGKPITVLFTIIAPTVRGHLNLLSRLAAALNDSGFRDAVMRKAPEAEILRESQRVEEAR